MTAQVMSVQRAVGRTASWRQTQPAYISTVNLQTRDWHVKVVGCPEAGLIGNPEQPASRYMVAVCIQMAAVAKLCMHMHAHLH